MIGGVVVPVGAGVVVLGGAVVVLVGGLMVVLVGGVLVGGLVVVVVGGVVQVGVVIVSWIKVTAPVPEACSPPRSRPSTVTALPREMLSWARMVPRKVEPAPRVAALPTFQKMLQELAPLTRLTLPVLPVINVDAVWKMKTEFGLFAPSRTSVPDIPNVPDAELYTPPTSFCPASSVGTWVVGPCPAALL